MKEIKLQDKTYLFIEVPNNSHDFHILSPNKENWNGNYLIGKPDIYELIDKVYKNNWEIISTTKDITEEQAGNMVGEVIEEHYQGYKHYHNKLYQTEDDWTSYYVEAKESLQSLIQSIGLDIHKNYLILQKL